MLHRAEAEGVHRIEDAHTNWYLVESEVGLTGHGPVWNGSLAAAAARAREAGPA